MTSNIGTRQLKEFGKGIGFAAQVRTDDKEYSRSVITKALNKSFAPEFINRLDEIITFDQLDLDALTRIIDIELKGLYSRVKNIGYKLVIDEDAKKFVATKGYDVQFGARPLKRAIQNNLEDGISELILGSEMAAGDTIKVSYDKEKRPHCHDCGKVKSPKVIQKITDKNVRYHCIWHFFCPSSNKKTIQTYI